MRKLKLQLLIISSLMVHQGAAQSQRSIDQTLPSRQVHLDFHNSEFIEGIGERFDKTEWQNALKTARVNQINIFAKCHHSWSYYPTKVGMVHPHLKFDLLGAQIEACHEIGVKCPVYLTVGWSAIDAEMHPEWCARQKDGSYQVTRWDFQAEMTAVKPRGSWKWLCPAAGGSYHEHIKRQVEEICRSYSVDGFWFDIYHVASRGCYCEWCVKDDLFDRLIPQWARRDTGGALTWTMELADSKDRARALMHLSNWLEGEQFELAVALAQSLPGENEGLVVALASQWVRREPAAAAAWASLHPEGPLREKLLAGIAAAWAAKDPQAAADFVLRFADGPAQNNAIISVVSTWSTRNPTDVARWVEGFPDGRLRTYAIENLAFWWAWSDFRGMAAWVDRLPGSGDRDTAINASAGKLVEIAPDLATQWADLIDNPSMRHRQVGRAARRWLETDPDAAWVWIARSDLPSETKTKLAHLYASQ